MANKSKSGGNGSHSFAIVTGASSGIGYYLARECAQNGFDLLVAADDPAIRKAAEIFARSVQMSALLKPISRR